MTNEITLATRKQRFGAAFIDVIIGIGIAALLSLFVSRSLAHWNFQTLVHDPGRIRTITYIIRTYMVTLGGLMFLALHGYLLRQYGQTIGKRIIGIHNLIGTHH